MESAAPGTAGAASSAKPPTATGRDLRRALAWRFVGWALVLALTELIVSLFEAVALAPLLSLAIQHDYTIGSTLGISGILRWAVVAVWTRLTGPGAGGLGLLSGSAAFLILGLMLGLFAAPIIGVAHLFSRQAEHLVQSELAARDEELRRAYERRNLMISDMAHDLRTPVMGISGLAQALGDGLATSEEEQARMLSSIRASSDKLGSLTNLLFEYVKLESEGFSLDRRVIDLPQLLLSEAAAAYDGVERAGMELSVHVSEEPVHILADETQLRRVVANLIGNAVRHNTPGTTVELALGRRAGVADIIVADSGNPIEQDAATLFEPFARGDVSRTGEGSGLGLSIVKTIVDMHGYSITLTQPYAPYTKAFIVTCELSEG